MTRITKTAIEKLCIEQLQRLVYQHLYARDMASGEESPERSSYKEALLNGRLQNAVRRINPQVPPDAQEEASKVLQRIHSPEFLAGNKDFYRKLTEGD